MWSKPPSVPIFPTSSPFISPKVDPGFKTARRNALPLNLIPACPKGTPTLLHLTPRAGMRGVKEWRLNVLNH